MSRTESLREYFDGIRRGVMDRIRHAARVGVTCHLTHEEICVVGEWEGWWTLRDLPWQTRDRLRKACRARRNARLSTAECRCVLRTVPEDAAA